MLTQAGRQVWRPCGSLVAMWAAIQTQRYLVTDESARTKWSRVEPSQRHRESLNIYIEQNHNVSEKQNAVSEEFKD